MHLYPTTGIAACCARRERPRCGRAAERDQQFPAERYSIARFWPSI